MVQSCTAEPGGLSSVQKSWDRVWGYEGTKTEVEQRMEKEGRRSKRQLRSGKWHQVWRTRARKAEVVLVKVKEVV